MDVHEIYVKNAIFNNYAMVEFFGMSSYGQYFFGLKSMESGLSNAVSDVSLRFLVNFLDSFYSARRKLPKKVPTHAFFMSG